MRRVGEIWLFLGIGALLFRTVHLFFLRDVQTGLVWLTKILTDPFHDVKLYCKAPLYLLRGELVRAREPRRARLKHFLEHAATQGFVGGGGLGPPPLVLLHRARGGDDALGDLGEIRRRVVQAEYQAPGADPAQGDAGLA